MAPIYLDYNARTPIAPEVAAVMGDAMDGAFGNPSSLHWAGGPAHEIVEKASGRVSNLLGCTPEEVVFMSSGSEANNLALKGTLVRLVNGGVKVHDHGGVKMYHPVTCL